ncbi:TPA: hypothetical protein ACVO4S_003158 [Vibrio diabolicus]
MYKTIQRLVGHHICRIGPDGPCSCDSTEDNVSVLTTNGDWKAIPFGGFMEVGNVIGVRRLKIMDVCALCSDDDGHKVVYTIPRNHYLVGTYLNGKCFILLYDGEVKHYLDKNSDQNTKNNVVWL